MKDQIDIANEEAAKSEMADSSSTVDERLHHFAEFVTEVLLDELGEHTITEAHLIERYLEWETRHFPLSGDPEEQHDLVLQVGMRVLIKDDIANHGDASGEIRTITQEITFQGKRAFIMYGSDGTWLIEDFSECVDYPGRTLK